jgi:hypothetical protein
MSHPLQRLLLLTLLCAASVRIWADTSTNADATASSLASSQDSAWSLDVVPYLWVAGYEGSLGVPGTGMGAPPTQAESTASFTTHLSAAAMVTALLRYRDVGVLFDGAWVQLKTEGEVSASAAAELQTDIAYGTLALGYRLPPLGELQTDVYAGARVWHISNQIEMQPGTEPGFTAESSRTWTDPLIGASLQYELSPHWYGTVLGDVGGFGVGSDITWSVFGGVGYRFTDWFSTTLGYRFLHVDYNHDDFALNGNVQGFLLGLSFHF